MKTIGISTKILSPQVELPMEEEISLEVETPVEETPIEETPVAEAPIVEEPVQEAPVAEAPIVEEPVQEAPVAETAYEQPELTLDFGADLFSTVVEPEPAETVESQESQESPEIPETIETPATPETPEILEAPEIPVEQPSFEELESLDEIDTIDSLDEIDEIDSLDSLEPAVVEAPVAAPVAEPTPVVEAPAAPVAPAPAAAPVEAAPKSSDARVSAFLQKYLTVGNTRNDSLLHTSIDDIGRAMSLGDQFFFKHVLFEDNGELMNKTIAALNAAGSFNDAAKYIVANFSQKWETIDQATVARFMEVVQRRFI